MRQLSHELNRNLKCYFALIKAYIAGSLLGKWSLCLYILGIFLMYLSSFIGLWLIMRRFHYINGWAFGDILIIFSISLISYGFRNLFFIQFRRLGIMIKDGSLAVILTRPLNPFLYIMGNRFELGGISHVTLGILLLFIFKKEINVAWGIHNLVYFGLALISATLVQGGVTVFIGSTAFFLTETTGLDRIYNGMREFIWYPISLYNTLLKVVLFCIVPLAFASYVPAGIFLNKPEYQQYPKWIWEASLLAGLVIFLLAYKFWEFSLNRYQSTGT